MAIESDLVTADMVEAMEFPHLAVKYEVRGVPRTVVERNGDIIATLEGALPEARFVEAILSKV